ncbi:hypothetical protein BDK51DRAFT_40322 [Blyttiomyces helicus]|uniref:Uncharacterized protein n=1 Tax=Blyttiomyces helicus TaxID=388810 RepID=A0A4P9WBA4_9FUNG|nr:hypothetical protein BDK51DRAFT_40322 [Blyttiomyces helicus]|eukprot:RKO88190.1 hypothetical protein BDK51DRAFT_40322 [Blyttiomyces helicus]
MDIERRGRIGLWREFGKERKGTVDGGRREGVVEVSFGEGVWAARPAAIPNAPWAILPPLLSPPWTPQATSIINVQAKTNCTSRVPKKKSHQAYEGEGGATRQELLIWPATLSPPIQVTHPRSEASSIHTGGAAFARWSETKDFDVSVGFQQGHPWPPDLVEITAHWIHTIAHDAADPFVGTVRPWVVEAEAGLHVSVEIARRSERECRPTIPPLSSSPPCTLPPSATSLTHRWRLTSTALSQSTTFHFPPDTRLTCPRPYPHILTLEPPHPATTVATIHIHTNDPPTQYPLHLAERAPPPVNITTRVSGGGFHHHATISIENAGVGTVVAVWPLGRGVFADPFEVGRLEWGQGVRVTVLGEMDLEAPAYARAASAGGVRVSVGDAGRGEVEVRVPVHMRYQAPEKERSHVMVEIVRPWVYHVGPKSTAAPPPLTLPATLPSLASLLPLPLHDPHWPFISLSPPPSTPLSTTIIPLTPLADHPFIVIVPVGVAGDAGAVEGLTDPEWEASENKTSAVVRFLLPAKLSAVPAKGEAAMPPAGFSRLARGYCIAPKEKQQGEGHQDSGVADAFLGASNRPISFQFLKARTGLFAALATNERSSVAGALKSSAPVPGSLPRNVDSRGTHAQQVVNGLTRISHKIRVGTYTPRCSEDLRVRRTGARGQSADSLILAASLPGSIFWTCWAEVAAGIDGSAAATSRVAWGRALERWGQTNRQCTRHAPKAGVQKGYLPEAITHSRDLSERTETGDVKVKATLKAQSAEWA